MSPTLKRSSAVGHYKRSNVIEICNRAILDFYKGLSHTVDREIFTLKMIRVKIFVLLNFRGFVQSPKFLTVDNYNMDERLQSSFHLVYYQVSGEPGIAGCSRRSDIYPGECGLACASLFIDRRHLSLIFVR